LGDQGRRRPRFSQSPSPGRGGFPDQTTGKRIGPVEFAGKTDFVNDIGAPRIKNSGAFLIINLSLINSGGISRGSAWEMNARPRRSDREAED